MISKVAARKERVRPIENASLQIFNGADDDMAGTVLSASGSCARRSPTLDLPLPCNSPGPNVKMASLPQQSDYSDKCCSPAFSKNA